MRVLAAPVMAAMLIALLAGCALVPKQNGSLEEARMAIDHIQNGYYWTQAEKELSGTGIELVKIDVGISTAHIDWLAETIPAGRGRRGGRKRPGDRDEPRAPGKALEARREITNRPGPSRGDLEGQARHAGAARVRTCDASRSDPARPGELPNANSATACRRAVFLQLRPARKCLRGLVLLSGFEPPTY